MKATEVLNRYATGERDFRRDNLRGQSFKGQELSGADFSEADIRGTNFSNASLRDADFTKARAGIQRHQAILLLVVASLLIVTPQILGGGAGLLIIILLKVEAVKQYFVAGCVMCIACTVVFMLVIQQGYAKAKEAWGKESVASRIVLACLSLSAIGAILLLSSLVLILLNAYVSVVIFAFAGILALINALSLTVGVAGFPAMYFLSLIITLVSPSIIIGNIVGLVIEKNLLNAYLFAWIALAIFFLIALTFIYLSLRFIKETKQFSYIRMILVNFTCLGGTSFRKSDLTRVNFKSAILESCDFREAILTHSFFLNSMNLHQSRQENPLYSPLSNPSLRDLLITRKGSKEKEFYVDVNLQVVNLDEANLCEADLKGSDLTGATLQYANLQGANLKGSDLTGAALRHANLQGANLTGVQAVGVDLYGAALTGACLEAWNIDHTTKLENVDCQYVYLLEHPNKLGSRERRPHDPDQVFAAGDFEKLYKKVMNVVQVLLKNGMKNQAAFNEAFQQLLDEQPTLSRNSLQAVERKGDDALVTLEVPEAADKAEISRSLHQSYEDKVLRLEAKVEELHQLRAADLKEVALAQKAQFFNQFTLGGSAMQEANESSRNINVGGDLNATGSTFNLGEIRGSVSNVVNQLPSAPDPAQPGIKELLIELQAAIENDADLLEKGKASALEQVKVLAEVAQNPEQPEKKGLGSQAVTFFKNAASFLPDTAKLAEAVSKLLPLITKALGLPF